MKNLNLRGKAILAVAALAFVSGCTQQYGQKETIGTIGGATAGAVVGSQFGGGDGRLAATALGTLLGAYAGNEIGKSLDRADKQAAAQAMERAYEAPVGQTVSWNNPESGHSGVVTTTNDGYTSSGAYCREYQQTINVGGRTQTAYGTACQRPDGSWQIQQ